ncbi:helix-turn-helix domain-containing protein [Skermania piniformis]|uniref:Helix-turn-helix domain-containing protein n=1 Tax=Skermania pinensis TaxID=39122 RepID=A0ABX8S8D0_9ACTN|nr:helix-turn-helix domain-containing protein [Skermania piniformis]QXQ12815.1 helix-turn-helix domain-containing protein [Skermania piniformis]
METIGTYSRKAYLTERFLTLRNKLSHNSTRAPTAPAVHRHARKRHLTKDEVSEIVARYNAGTRSTQLVTETGLAKETILKLLHTNGATIRRRGLSVADIAEAATLYRDGRSLEWIGKHFGVSHTTVRAALKKHGVKMRDTHGRER